MANHVKRVSDTLLLDWIAKFNNSQGRSPTIREICAGVGYSSPATVHRRVAQLADQGMLKDVRLSANHRELKVAGRPVGREASLEDVLAEGLAWFNINHPNRDIPRWVLKSRALLAQRDRRG